MGKSEGGGGADRAVWLRPELISHRFHVWSGRSRRTSARSVQEDGEMRAIGCLVGVVVCVALLEVWSGSVARATQEAESSEQPTALATGRESDTSVNVIHSPELALSNVYTAAPPERDAAAVNMRPRRSWYGWQTLTADGVSLLLLGLAAEVDGDNLSALAFGSYMVGAPVVHLSHRQWVKAGGSLGVRALVPLIGAGVYSAQSCPESDEERRLWCDLGRDLTTGLVVALAAVTASALDAAVFGWETHEPEPTVCPVAGATHQSAWLGLGGRF